MITDSLDQQNPLLSISPLQSSTSLVLPGASSPFDLRIEQDVITLSASSYNPILSRPSNYSLPLTVTSGSFTVGSTGQVGIDYLFDGGGYQGELGIFSLEGLEQFDPGSQEFIQEVVSRVLSHSLLGNVVISDASEGARFSGSFAWEGDFNGGNYLGVKTVAMNPGDRFGVVLLPNGTFQHLVGNADLSDDQRLLFSLTTANPNSAFQFGQIADVTGNGSTFTMEDLRLDGSSDRDYNDVVFQVRGAIGSAISLDQVIDPNLDWRGSAIGQALLSYIATYDAPKTAQPVDYHFPQTNQPLIGIIDTGFAANNPDIDYSHITLGHDYVDGDSNPLLAPGEGNEHGTHILGLIGATQNNGIGIDGINDQAPIWLGRAIGSGKWANSLVEFVDAAKKSGQPHAVANLSFDLTQKNPDGSVTTRYEFTPQERQALEYARQNGVLIIAAAGNDGGTMSALGQASQEFDNIITVGAINYNDKRAVYSSFGYGLDLVAYGGTSNDPVVSTMGSGNDLKHLVEELGLQVPLHNLPSQLFPTGNSASSEASAEPDEVLPDDEMAANARNTFAEVFGAFDEIDEAELENLTPEERQVYEEATQEIDQLLSEYLGSASQKLALEYVDGYYETQVNALSQFVDAFDENIADNLINAQAMLKDAGFNVKILAEEPDPNAPLDLGLGAMAGTSVATAEVTGAASQVWAANPNLSYAQIKDILKQTAIDLNTPGWDTETGAGKVDLTAAVELAKVTKPETSHPQPLLSPLTWSGEGQLFPGERPVSTAVPSFTGRVMNVGYVSTLGYQRVRSAPSTTASQVGVKYPGEALTFDAYENNGSWYSDPVVGGSSRWYHIAGTNQWMWAGYIDNSPEQAEQERQRQDAIRRSEAAARLAQEALQRAEEEARRAEAELQRIEAEQLRIQEEQRRQREAFQALVNGITQKYGDPGLLMGSWVSNGVNVYQFVNGQMLVQPDGRYSFSDSRAKSSQIDRSSSKFHLHIEYEKLAKNAIYAKNYTEGEEINGYKVEKVFKDDLTGLYAIGLSKQGVPPVLVFRGTESKTVQDIVTDLDPRGIGSAQLAAAFREGVGEWLKGESYKGVKPDVIGHSLGGALAQMTAASYSDNIDQTVTFNSPGIDEKWLLLFKGGDVTQYISQADLVSQGGRAFLPGKFYSLSFAGDPLKQHLNLFLNDPNVVCTPVTMDEISGNDLTTSWLRNPIEFVRQQVGMELLPVYALVDTVEMGMYLGEKIANGVGTAIHNGFNFLSSTTNSAFEAVKQKVEDAKQKAQELVASAKAAYQVAQATVQQAQKAYQTFKQEVQQKATQIVQQSQQKMKEIAQSIAQKVANNPVVQAVSKVGNFVASYANKAVQAVSNVINGAKQFVSNVIETGKQFVNNVIETGKQAYQSVTNFVSAKVEQGKQVVVDTYNKAAQAVNTVTNTVSNGINGLKHVFGW